MEHSEVIHVGSQDLAAKASMWFRFIAGGRKEPQIKIDAFPSVPRGLPSEQIHPSKQGLVFIGGFETRKGLRHLADAVQSGVISGYEFEVVGALNPLNPEEISLFRRLQRLEPFTIRGQISDSELGILLSKASVVLYLSTAEGYGLPIVEAANFGCPVVAADTSVNREIAQSIGNVFLVPTAAGEIDINQIGAVIEHALSRKGKMGIQEGLNGERPHDWAAKVLKADLGGRS